MKRSGSTNQDDDNQEEKQISSETDSKMIMYATTNLGGNSTTGHALNLVAPEHEVVPLVNRPCSLALQTYRMPDPSYHFESVADAKAEYDAFPPTSTIERNLLAATLPVAASFHPAELFGSSADDRSMSVGAELRQQSADATLLRAAAFLENSPNLPSDPSTRTVDLRTQNQNPTDYSTIEGTVDTLLTGRLVPQEPGLPITNIATEGVTFDQGRATTAQHSTSHGSTGNAFFLSQLLFATSNPSTMGACETETLPVLSQITAALQANTEVSCGEGVEDVLYFGKGPEIFPMTLHRCLMDLESDANLRDIANFILPHGRSFIVNDTKRFETELLPRYFPRMGRFASFQRQLNLYNFGRIGGTGRDRGAYCHELFVRDVPDLSCQMRRTKIKGLFKVPVEKRRKRGRPPNSSMQQQQQQQMGPPSMSTDGGGRQQQVSDSNHKDDG